MVTPGRAVAYAPTALRMAISSGKLDLVRFLPALEIGAEGTP
jgi:hypothetical protein